MQVVPFIKAGHYTYTMNVILIPVCHAQNKIDEVFDLSVPLGLVFLFRFYFVISHNANQAITKAISARGIQKARRQSTTEYTTACQKPR